MHRMSFVVEPDESILWEGRPRPSAWLPPTFLLSVFGLGLIILLTVAGVHDAGITFLFPWTLIIIVICVTVFLLYMKTHYYITGRRIVKTIELYLWKGVWTLPLESLVDASLKGPAKGRYVVFVPSSPDRKRIIFHRLEHPESVREIALHARSSLLHSDK